jgi:transcription elongation factor Elf1
MLDDRMPSYWRADWRVLFTCQVCGSDVVRLVRGDPDEHVRCDVCESKHVQRISDRLLRMALSNAD